MSAALPAIVTFTTDFGSTDAYVGAMKGQVLQRCRSAVLVDISHDVDPGDIRRAALVLQSAVANFPHGAIHVAVVDPGVGSDRRALVVDCEDYLLVGPDNGVLSLAMTRSAQAYVLDRPEYFASAVSPTFHGRDVFSPVAGLLAAGAAASELGSLTTEVDRLSIPQPRRSGGGLEGEVLYADRFGNLVTNLHGSDVQAMGREITVSIGDLAVGRIRRTYSDGNETDLIALFGSDDRLEIAVVGGSAEDRLGSLAGRGACVRVEPAAADA